MLITDKERQLIKAYIPTPRDKSLGPFDYYVKDISGRVYKVFISGIYPYLDETRYSVFTDGGKRVTDFTSDGNFPMRHIYDNKQDCIDETHNYYDDWEQLRKLQEKSENNPVEGA